MNNAEHYLLRLMDSRIPGIGWGREVGVEYSALAPPVNL